MNSKCTWSTKEISSRERETEANHERVTDWVKERKRLSKRASEREREGRTNQVSNLKLAGVRWPH